MSAILELIEVTIGFVSVVYSSKKLYEISKEKVVQTLIEKKKRKLELNEHQLLLGYDLSNYEPLIVDMSVVPHLFVCGLSRCGKSRMIESAIQDKNVVLINAFEHDFKSVKARRINSKEKILEYLQGLIKEPYHRKKPLYVVIDELLVLCLDKDITRAIMDLLAIARHYNVYLIGIAQIGNKDVVKFKDLFNCRICFRQVEDSSYRTVLGYSPEVKELRPRQFHLYSDKLAFGYTYDIRAGT